MSRNIDIKIQNLKTIVSGEPVIVCNNSDYIITFAFDEDWEAYDVKTARFVYTRDGHIQSQDVVFTGNVCSVPVFYDITDVFVGVFAGDIHTTTPAKIFCVKSILDYDGQPEEPSPDVYAQIMEMINSGRLQGPAGEAGATYTPEVSDDGELSWTNDRGLDNPEPVNIRGPQGKDGSPGPQGPPGDNTAALEAAQVANEAADKANAAADAARELAPEVEQLKHELSDLAPAGATVGQLFRVAAISEDGKYTMEPVDMLDVQINDASIVRDGVAVIPIANGEKAGLIKSATGQGHYIDSSGTLFNQQASNEFINARSNIYTTISPNNLDYAVKAAMCDGKGAAWTTEEQAAARERIGMPRDYALIDDITLEEEINYFSYTKEPDGTPLNLKKFIVIIDSFPEGTWDSYLRIDAWTKESPNLVLKYLKEPTMQGKYVFFAYEAIGQNLYRVDAGIQTIGANVFLNGKSDISSRNYGTLLINDTNIIRIDVSRNINADTLPAGTHIKIYGVRA